MNYQLHNEEEEEEEEEGELREEGARCLSELLPHS